MFCKRCPLVVHYISFFNQIHKSPAVTLQVWLRPVGEFKGETRSQRSLPCKQLELLEQVFSIFRNINTKCAHWQQHPPPFFSLSSGEIYEIVLPKYFIFRTTNQVVHQLATDVWFFFHSISFSQAAIYLQFIPFLFAFFNLLLHSSSAAHLSLYICTIYSIFVCF